MATMAKWKVNVLLKGAGGCYCSIAIGGYVGVMGPVLSDLSEEKLAL